ncbi:LOW QUALITY PROTEIN: uncharacterized protein LOC132178040 [Corylus avellana]|uniref:LOW QUALITY PROTEIN: uncharacterized protein LOC132178040 n=1 Tax=Corylus avellana TaxID=13451 RepID=UPI00286CA55D|nr:LOW QUALITY PROTEIN: uncharacterized protein LOC132178040 [Corylus avellana]
MKSVFAKKSGSESESETGSRFVFGAESTRRFTRGLGELRGRRSRSTRRAEFSVGNRVAMPSVGMRRTTRVFGVVKGVDGGARVLRSGRRLWPESGDDWFKLVKNPGNGDGLGCKKPAWAVAAKESRHSTQVLMIAKQRFRVRKSTRKVSDGVDKLFGIVYNRKRKRYVVPRGGGFSSGDSDRMYGIRFVRRQRRKVDGGGGGLVVPLARPVLVVCGGGEFVGCFLYWVLSYMRRAELSLTQLSSFLCSDPIAGVYNSCGIQFFRDPPISSGSGICNFFGAMQNIPLFSVDFSAVPLCFMYMHYRMLLRFQCRPFVVNNSIDGDTDGDMLTDSEEDESEEHRVCIPFERDLSECIASVVDPSECKNMVHEVLSTESRAHLHPSVRASKLARRTQYRNALNYRGIRKRRSSLRRRRARNPSLALASDAASNRRSGMPLSSVMSNSKLRSSVQRSSAQQINDVSSTLFASRQDVDSSCCSANILVIEADKCYREEGANVMLEGYDSREWLLAVKKDGLTRCTLKAEKIMRPCSCNRVTHAITWSLDNGWKLEFPNRLDWQFFKDLYKECSDRNMLAPIVKHIPVPGVLEVSDYWYGNTTTFLRPDSYISVKDDEVSRAMARSTANYDMDSEDEKWLEKFNKENFTEIELHQHVSENTFELMVDAFEKAYYFSPDDLPDEKAAANLCPDMGRSEVVEAVYNYWMKKRKQKRAALVRIFQGHQAKRPPVIPKPLFRKRRSFKRQPSQFGRGKPPSVLQAIAAEQDAFEEKNAMLKVEEANASANNYMDLAIRKRKRAQFLMENADLATYRAMMAIRIAEAARVGESPDATSSYFLD